MLSRFSLPQVTTEEGLPSSMVSLGFPKYKSHFPHVTTVVSAPFSTVSGGALNTRSRFSSPHVTSVLGFPSVMESFGRPKLMPRLPPVITVDGLPRSIVSAGSPIENACAFFQ